MTTEATKVTLTVENPKPHTRYYVVAQPIYTPPAYVLNTTRSFEDSDDTRSSSSTSSSSTVHAKQVRNTQPQCQIKSCSKFCKRGAKLCTKCEQTCSQELNRISLERASRNK